MPLYQVKINATYNVMDVKEDSKYPNAKTVFFLIIEATDPEEAKKNIIKMYQANKSISARFYTFVPVSVVFEPLPEPLNNSRFTLALDFFRED
ncbi:hypothetical protein SAMN05428988_3205 [Chitinophaga sp. YR573]|uniref:hypothetical protein n=1 Tax=Chitinophaga sp. YR573 TaxID=1881040 RepID=UPI0008B0FAE4|nr:hypothetical protein [Chitinophaga sp. YR573]SEW21392.1 hypothetical protein SAMN05428988_3205 [Chitinophaga sp. YR573]